jgi:signal transduction histidine kinase
VSWERIGAIFRHKITDEIVKGNLEEVKSLVGNIIDNREKINQQFVKKLNSLRKHSSTLSISTKKDGDKVLISVMDNGNGIPQKNIEKIFQPFFTTNLPGRVQAWAHHYRMIL